MFPALHARAARDKGIDMDVDWGTDFFVSIGNMLGYSRVNMGFKTALSKLGVNLNGHGSVSIQVCYPEKYFPVPGRANVLITMFESEDLPDFFVESLNKADAIVVPSEYCGRVFQRYTDVPVHVVPLGIDHSIFHFFERVREPNRPFRWLWTGARNPRKGWREVIWAWDLGKDGERYRDRQDCELFLKTLGDDNNLRRNGNVITCTQAVSDEDMARIYADADGFIFPTQGEGFGWTAAEAMATGLPCVMPLHTGMLDWADETTCVPLPYETGGYGVMSTHGGGTCPIPLLTVKVEDVRDRMDWVMNHPEEVKEIARRGAERVQKYTWESAGRMLLDILRQLETGNPGFAAEEIDHGNTPAGSQDFSAGESRDS